MLRERVRLKIYQLDEVTLQRKDEFHYTEEDRTDLEIALETQLHGRHITLHDGRVFVVSVASIDNDD